MIGYDCDESRMKKMEEESDEFPRLVLYFTGSQFAHAVVVADGIQIDTQANDIGFSVLVLIASYYVFNIKYPTCWQHFLGLLQHIIVQEKYGNASASKVANKILELEKAMEKEGPKFSGIGKQV